MNFIEQAFVFPCAGEELVGIVAKPECPQSTGVLMVVGGPQYRIGSHRQFLLFSRALAEAGYTVMRFDYRGMGDSSGKLREFEMVNEDIAAAISAYRINFPQVERVVLWGLCDAASASLLYWDATHDARVCGLVLLNPWVRSDASLAKTHIKHYYGQRLFQAEFWRKLLTGKVGVGRAISGLIDSVKTSHLFYGRPEQDNAMPFHQKMARGLNDFPGQVLILLSGEDYTAKEFIEVALFDPLWACCLARNSVEQVEVPYADHTFSSSEWRTAVENATRQWLDSSYRS